MFFLYLFIGIIYCESWGIIVDYLLVACFQDVIFSTFSSAEALLYSQAECLST